MHNHEISVKILRFSRRLEEILTVLLWLFLLFGFDRAYVAGLTIASALIHEGGHIAVLSFNKRTRAFALGRLSGPRISVDKSLSYNRELMLYLGGAGANLAVFIITLPFWKSSGYIATFGAVNLATAVSNLLPLRGHDGYGALLTVLHRFGAPRICYSLLRGLSVGLCALGCSLGLFLLQKAGEGYWLYAIFYFSLVCELFGQSDSIF